MKKIGILTLSASDNCGSLLQAFALQHVLREKIKGDVEIINFSSERAHIMYDIFPKSGRRNIKSYIKRLYNYTKLKRQKEHYKKFKEDYLNIYPTNELFTEDLSKIEERYDVVVVGSDQVWNVKMFDFDEAFFCDWAKCKKIAYAPSLGGHDLRESNQYESFAKSILSFEHISVREEKGKKCLEDLTGRKVNYVLDPTLLLDSDKWIDLAGKERIVSEKYIFYYSWAYCEDEVNQIVYEEGKRLGLPVYVLDASKWKERSITKWDFKLSEQEGPKAFLNLMYYAEHCYVQSFHGFIFAYVFEKNVWLLDTKEDFNDLDTRLKEIITQLDKQDRILTKYNYHEVDKDCKTIYGKNEYLEQLKERSIRYIEDSLGGYGA